jgi:Rps23 Pro-64 3,4-dihydroxylase Tpa1-like proline 4-hydroxylase
MMINTNSFQQAIQCNLPFKFSLLNGLIPWSNLIDLYETAPFHDLDLTTRAHGSDKTYNLYNCLLFDHVTEKINSDIELSTSWKNIINDFTSEDYKQKVSSLIKNNVTNCYIQAMLKVYKAGSYISMHTDDKDVALTHLIFINPFYNFNNKGNLYFHDATGNKVVSIPPDPNISVIFSRENESFHSVDSCESNDLPKVSLQIVFWKTKKQRHLSGRNYLSLI